MGQSPPKEERLKSCKHLRPPSSSSAFPAPVSSRSPDPTTSSLVHPPWRCQGRDGLKPCTSLLPQGPESKPQGGEQGCSEGGSRLLHHKASPLSIKNEISGQAYTPGWRRCKKGQGTQTTVQSSSSPAVGRTYHKATAQTDHGQGPASLVFPQTSPLH